MPEKRVTRGRLRRNPVFTVYVMADDISEKMGVESRARLFFKPVDPKHVPEGC